MYNGLTSAEVAERKSQGLVNTSSEIKTKSIPRIFRDNVLTLFNILNFVMAGLVFSIGEFTQATFLVLIVMNIFVGVFQEIRAKKTIDKLSLINQPKATVMRDGTTMEVAITELVMDDLTVLDTGKQVCADSIITFGSCEVNESMLTGESDAVLKSIGDTLFSGSFITSGSVKAKIIHVGKDNYANKICSSAKYVKKTRAEIPLTLKAIIRLMSFVVIPLAIGTFIKGYVIKHSSIEQAILNTVASSISMVPQGLVALSSVVFAASAVRLSAHNTLSQDLYCTETLARVDTLCLDKTGTITEGTMVVDRIVDVANLIDIDRILTAITNSVPDKNPTADAIREYCKNYKSNLVAISTVPFSSSRKWSGAVYEEGSFIMGAGEFIFPETKLLPYKDKLSSYSQQGERVITVAFSRSPIVDNTVPDDTILVGFVLISDKIRQEAPDTLRYFAEQNVDIKIISGDNPITVSAIAVKAGLKEGNLCVDASTLDSDEKLASALKRYKVFGRVTPEQKLKIVKSLQSDGHTVAMTGDGVNDVLALKEADCSIAMASGSDAARTVSHLVLLDSNFAHMPKIVSEGRRTINNLQRTASLYLVKTIYSMLLALFFLFFGKYPFQPLHMTLVGSMTIGIPSFILALQPNEDLVQDRFLVNVLKKSLPCAITVVVFVVISQIMQFALPLNNDVEVASVALLILAVPSYYELILCSLPFNVLRGIMVITMGVCFVLAWNIFPAFLSLTPLYDFNLTMIIICVPLMVISIPFMAGLNAIMKKQNSDFRFIDKILRIEK